MSPGHPGLCSGVTRVVVSLLQGLLPPPLELHPLDLLTRMSPLAFIQCVLYAQLSGELQRVREFSAGLLSIVSTYNSDQPQSGQMGFSKLLTLLVNGSIAFGLNVVSFWANGKVGPLSMTVAGVWPLLLLPVSSTIRIIIAHNNLNSKCEAGPHNSRGGVNL